MTVYDGNFVPVLIYLFLLLFRELSIMEEEQLSQRLPDTCPMSESSQATCSQKLQMDPPWGRLCPVDAVFQPIELMKDDFTVGRAPQCDFEIKEKIGKEYFFGFSKIHFRIKRKPVSNDDYVVYLEDLSHNGTFVNGVKVGKGNSVVLETNDEISMIYNYLKIFIYISSVLDPETRNYPDEVKKKYAISRLLGSGACGIVKLVYEKSTGKAFAMKIIQKKRFRNERDQSQYQPERLQREVTILKSLSHVFVIRFETVIDSPDHLFILTEYVGGGDLFDRLKACPLTELEVKLYFYQLALAINYLHGQDIIHRDVKLENILLSSRSTDSIVKLSDFGYSRFLDSESVLMTFCGTPSYIAPEILEMRGKKGTYDKQIDIWSMGVVLYTCLSGELPFTGKTKRALTDQVLSGSYHFPKALWSQISGNAINLVKRMLTVNPRRRITIDGILNHPWLKDESVEVRISRLLSTCQIKCKGVRQHSSDDEDEVAAKKPKLENPSTSS